MQNSWQDILSVLGALQGALLSVLLISRKANRRPNRVLGVFTLIYSMGLLERILRPYRGQAVMTYLSDLLGGTVFLYAPLVYIFIYLLLKGPISRKRWLQHLAPFTIYTLGMTAVHLFAPAPQGQSGGDVLELVVLLFLYIQIFYYSFLSIRMVLKAEAAETATRGYVPLRWLKALIIGLTVIYSLSFLGILLVVFGFPIGQSLFIIVQVASVVVVYLLSYFALVQPQLAYAPLNHDQDAPPKYQGSSLSDTDKQQLLERILRHTETAKPYLVPNLSIEEFAGQVDVNRYYISQVINECLEQNFSDFINAYRVQETQALLQDPDRQHLKILAIAYEGGFNSKTAFNTAFKKFTGMSPSQYRRQANSGSE
ncbi:MAG: helix-turn-helix transcriptional regulator [Lewinellaceae bacterium]|nr:helix-turn-helix transcriptional regulator [Phaeodactylibacter sp.]MCB9039274.1 helix-turn-helix transcriptional regulator [Lewinellaceae bacterium]